MVQQNIQIGQIQLKNQRLVHSSEYDKIIQEIQEYIGTTIAQYLSNINGKPQKIFKVYNQAMPNMVNQIQNTSINAYLNQYNKGISIFQKYSTLNHLNIQFYKLIHYYNSNILIQFGFKLDKFNQNLNFLIQIFNMQQFQKTDQQRQQEKNMEQNLERDNQILLIRKINYPSQSSMHNFEIDLSDNTQFFNSQTIQSQAIIQQSIAIYHYKDQINKILQKEQSKLYKVYPKAFSRDKQNFQDLGQKQILKNCVGLIIAFWEDQNKKIKSICYGTGFAINQRTVITCAHSLYHEKTRILSKKCTKVKFIPSHIKGPINKQMIYQSTNIAFDQPKVSFTVRPQKEEIAVIYLERQLSFSSYLKIENIQNIQTNHKKSKNLIISGFPSSKYKSQTNFQKIQPLKMDCQGEFIRLKDEFIINHNLLTQVGHSGSPLVFKGREQFVIGIHTHKGIKGENSAIAFTKQTYKSLQRLIDKVKNKQNKVYTPIFSNNQLQTKKSFNFSNLSEFRKQAENYSNQQLYSINQISQSDDKDRKSQS